MKRFFNIFDIVLDLLVIFLVGLFLFLRSEDGQNFLTKQVVSYLDEKLNTRFEIKKIRYRIPDWIALEGVYVEDLTKDTLVSGGNVRIDLNMLGLLKNNVGIDKIELENIRLKIKRTLPDTAFNFNFLVKAFTDTAATSEKDTASPSKPLVINLKKVILKNVHLTYNDQVIGTDADADLQNAITQFDAFDLNTSKYHIQKIDLNTAKIALNLYKPLKETPPSQTKKPSSDTLDFKLGDVRLLNVDWRLQQEESGLTNVVKLGVFEAKGDKIYLEAQKVHLKNIYLSNTSASVKMAKKVPEKTKTESSSPNNWAVVTDKVIFRNNTVQFDDDNKTNQKTGLDYYHLGFKKLNLEAERLTYAPDRITGWIQSGSFAEKSGFSLEKLQTDFAYTNTQTFLKRLYFKTPKTILRDELVLNYASQEQLSKNPGSTKVKLNLKNSQLAFSDVLLLMPDLAKTPPFIDNTQEILKFDGTATGTINRLSVSKFSMTGFQNARLQLSGEITGLPDADKTSLNLKVNEFTATKKDILKVLPPKTLPDNIELPERFAVKGTVAGGLKNLKINANLTSDLGNAFFDGSLINITASQNQTYKGNFSLDDFDMGKFLKKSDQIGKITLKGEVDGKGFDVKTMTTSIKGSIEKAFLNGYEYKNTELTANISNQLADIQASIDDPNIALKLNTKVNLARDFPGINGDMQVREINLKALGFYPDNLIIKGDIDIAMSNTDPANPEGKIDINKGILIKNGKSYSLENTTLFASSSGEDRLFRLSAPFLKASMRGNFNYLEVPDIMLTAINKYFTIPEVKYKPVEQPYHFTLEAKVSKHPVFAAFLPSLSKLDTVRLAARMDSRRDTILAASISMPFIEYDTVRVSNVKMNLTGDHSKMNYNASLDKVVFNDYKLRKTFLSGEVADNRANFNLAMKDSLNKEQYHLDGFVQNVENLYRMHLNQKGLLLNYQTWDADSAGYIQYSKDGLLVNNFLLKQGIQRLSVNTMDATPNGPLYIEADSLNIATFVTIATQDSLMAGGKLNGKITLSNYMQNPSFIGDLAIHNFLFQQTAIGDLIINTYNDSANKITAKASLINSRNDISLIGNYLLNSQEPLDFNLDINKLGAETIAAFSFGQLRHAIGNLRGKTSIKGAVNKPLLNGNLNFDAVAFDITQLGSRYVINKQDLTFVNQQVKFKNFTVSDTLNQPLIVNGDVSFANIPDVAYDLKVSATNFMVLNATQKDNDFFYGKGFVDANLIVKGVSSKATIDGDIKVKDNSKITVVMPDNTAETSEQDDIIVFVKDRKNKTTAEPDSVKKEHYAAADLFTEMSLNIEVNDKSEFIIIIDPLNGDNLKVKGKAQLNAGISQGGQPYILGLYELTEGSYDLSFEVLKRQFVIQKGGTMLWSGDPTNAYANITAIYKVDVAPYDLVLSDSPANLDLYRQKMSFNVLLKMEGYLKNIQPSFAIELADVQPSSVTTEVYDKVKEKLSTKNSSIGGSSSIVNNTAELNKQVFALLVLNRFFSEKSGDFFSGVSPEAIARQSVSKLLSDQLDRLASDLVTGVKLNVNLASTQGYTNGALTGRTDLSVGLSKAFLNEKLTVVVGRNFELENTAASQRNSAEIFDNVSLNYSLSDDGRYMVRVYRKNQYQAVLEGFVVETGVSFAVTMDYEKFKEIFKK